MKKIFLSVSSFLLTVNAADFDEPELATAATTVTTSVEHNRKRAHTPSPEPIAKRARSSSPEDAQQDGEEPLTLEQAQKKEEERIYKLKKGVFLQVPANKQAELLAHLEREGHNPAEMDFEAFRNFAEQHCYFEDDENVMRGPRMSAVRQSIENLLKDEEPALDLKETLKEMGTFINEEAKAKARWLAVKEHNDKFRIFNLKRVFWGPFQRGDLGRPLYEDQAYSATTTGTILRYVWGRIKSYVPEDAERTELERKILKENLMIGLSSAIEVDGHLVCNEGQVQRILTTLQGYNKDIIIDPETADLD